MTQPYEPSAPVLGLFVEPDSDRARVISVAANASGEIARIVGGPLEAIEIDGGSVMWLDAEGKNRSLATNLLATKIAHRLHAGLYPDDTINGRALIFGEIELREQGPVAVDLTAKTLEALRAVGVEVTAQASQEVVIVAGGSWAASLMHSNTGGGCMVTTQQIDDRVYVVGQDDFTVAAYSSPGWLGEAEEEPELIEAESARDAWELLQHLRRDCALHQCTSCHGWLFVSEPSRVGRLRCGTCGSLGE